MSLDESEGDFYMKNPVKRPPEDKPKILFDLKSSSFKIAACIGTKMIADNVVQCKSKSLSG